MKVVKSCSFSLNFADQRVNGGVKPIIPDGQNLVWYPSNKTIVNHLKMIKEHSYS